MCAVQSCALASAWSQAGGGGGGGPRPPFLTRNTPAGSSSPFPSAFSSQTASISAPTSRNGRRRPAPHPHPVAPARLIFGAGHRPAHHPVPLQPDRQYLEMARPQPLCLRHRSLRLPWRLDRRLCTTASSPACPATLRVGMLVAILGTTISPYLFYWQSSEEVEEEKARGQLSLRKPPRRDARRDPESGNSMSAIGTFFSNLVMYFINSSPPPSPSIATASPRSIHQKRPPRLLAPSPGAYPPLLYTVGLLGVGFLASHLVGSAAYALAETFHWKEGLDRPLGAHPPFTP